MLLKTLYSKNESYKILITVPHGARGDTFFARFPGFWEFFSNKTEKNLFCQYLRIEQDFGAKELAHSIANELYTQAPELGALVLENEYPRGVIDGGRKLDFCLRGYVPTAILDRWKNEFLHVHKMTLYQIRQELSLAKTQNCLGVDVHTMAPYSPAVQIEKEDFENLNEYVEAYMSARVQGGERRHLDLITEDGHGKVLSDPKIIEYFDCELGKLHTLSMNTPYAALPHFMMNEYIGTLKGLAIDVPKDFIAEGFQKEFQLDCFELSKSKIKQLSHAVAAALVDYINK